jgi:flagellar biosynthetic protein FliR
MNELLRSVSEQQTAGFLLVLARISPLFLLAPMFSSRSMPARARGVAAVALAVGIAPVAMRGQRIPLELAPFSSLMAKELLIGFAFAFAVGALVHAVTIAGTLLDTIAGYAFGALVDPLTGAQSAVLSQLYGLVAVMVFVTIGGDAWVIAGLARTYELVPLLGFPEMASVVSGVIAVFSHVFVAALQVAAPVLLALVLTDAGFGMVSRVVPQLNVFAVGFPAKILVALAVTGASLPFVAGFIGDEMRRSIASALEVVG